MADKYLSIITNFGCHYSCPECVVRNNNLKMTPTGEYSSYAQLYAALIGSCDDCNWVSVSGGGDPIYHWWKHQVWWYGFFKMCHRADRKTELHTSYFDMENNPEMMLFPFDKFNRIVYHLHTTDELDSVRRFGNEIVRVVFVVDDDMTEDEINGIADYVETSDQIDELSFRQRVDENYEPTYHLHDFLKAGHQKRWWYIEQCDYNTYYHNGKLYTKYTDIFEKESQDNVLTV